VRIPFNVVNGINEGPTLCVIGGIHPTEYIQIAAGIRLATEITPSMLNGTLIHIPVANIHGYVQREYVNPIDGINLQGNWPGKTGYEGGTISHLIVLRLWQNFVSKSNYFIDLHGSDIHETMMPSAHWFKTGNKDIDDVSEGMSRATGVKLLGYNQDPGGIGSSQRVASENGIPTTLYESGTGDRFVPEEVEYSFNVLCNVMKYLEMIEGKVPKNEEQFIYKSARVRSNYDGLFWPKVKFGATVKQGQVLGEVKDLYGDVLETLYAPSDGTIYMWMHNPYFEAGESVISIASKRE
jgi:predicted deacylase